MENIEYKTIKIKDYDLFEKGSACLINEGYVIHKKPTFISFVSEEKAGGQYGSFCEGTSGQ